MASLLEMVESVQHRQYGTVWPESDRRNALSDGFGYLAAFWGIFFGNRTANMKKSDGYVNKPVYLENHLGNPNPAFGLQERNI